MSKQPPEVSFSTVTIQQKKKITSLIYRNTQEALKTVNATNKIENEAVAEKDAGLAALVFKNIALIPETGISNVFVGWFYFIRLVLFLMIIARI